MTPEQEREFRALLAEVDEENSGWRSVMDPVAAELRDLRAALAASQAREAALGEALQLARQTTDDTSWGELCLAIERAINEVSPVAEALGRVVREVVACRRENAGGYIGTFCSEYRSPLSDAVEGLLAVAPHWGEPQGGG